MLFRSLNQAVIQQVTGTSDEHGILSVQLYPGPTDLPSLRGIEITQTGTAPPPPTLPGAPTALSATAVSATQINLSWTASSTSGVQYQVFRSTASGFIPSSSNQVATTATTTYSDTVLAAATTYYYVVEASNASGSSPASNQASATTSSNGGSNVDVVDINAGGAAAGSYLADTDFTGGTASSTTATINTSLVANPAPLAVYQTERFGDFTYTIPNLTPGASYTVNLHFAEIYWTAAGKREFNVLINGATALTNFDVFAAAGGENIAIVKSFPATAASNGTITIQFTTGAADLPKVSGIEITQPTTTTTTDLQIDAGGVASGAWLADEDFTGGTASSTTAAINTSLVTNPAPQAVYQTERFGDFTYTIPNLTPGTNYTVNLHFAEIYWTAAGKREFNVLLNGATVLTNFDVFAAAGGENIAIVKSFPATAASNGSITIQFATGAADLPKVSGIEVVN